MERELIRAVIQCAGADLGAVFVRGNNLLVDYNVGGLVGFGDNCIIIGDFSDPIKNNFDYHIAFTRPEYTLRYLANC